MKLSKMSGGFIHIITNTILKRAMVSIPVDPENNLCCRFFSFETRFLMAERAMPPVSRFWPKLKAVSKVRSQAILTRRGMPFENLYIFRTAPRGKWMDGFRDATLIRCRMYAPVSLIVNGWRRQETEILCFNCRSPGLSSRRSNSG